MQTEPKNLMHTQDIDLTATAKMLRKALAAKFPDIKFSVKTSRYSMGCSIDVSWTDGPISSMVSKITDLYCGAGFCGMTDSRYKIEHWLNPDGSVSLAYAAGTAPDGHLTELGAPTSADAVLVRFAPTATRANRRTTGAFDARVAAKISRDMPNYDSTDLYRMVRRCMIVNNCLVEIKD